MDPKGGIMMCEIKRVDGKWRAICGNERVDATGGNSMCELKRQTDKRGWMQQGAI